MLWIGGNDLGNLVVVAKNEEAGMLLNYLLSYNKLTGLGKQSKTNGAKKTASVNVNIATEPDSIKTKTL